MSDFWYNNEVFFTEETSMPKIQNHIKTLFCNGVANTYQDAQASALAISKILGHPVECCYNNGLYDLGFGAQTALAGTGLSLFSSHPFPLLFLGSRFQSLVEKRKSKCALLMAHQIKTHLNEDPLNRIFLILHSQGRDIGNQALRYLSLQQRSRIKVLTLGSSPIAKKAAAHVINLKQKGDLVPFFMQIRDRVSQLANLKLFPTKRETLKVQGSSHSLASYLNHPKVQHYLRTEHSQFAHHHI